MNKVRVLHVIDRLQIGGAEKVFVDITKLLTEKGIHTGVMLFSSGYPLDSQLSENLILHVLGRKNKYSLSKLYKANKICSSYNIVHVHMRHCYSYIKLAQVLFGGQYKIILHDHYGDIQINQSIPIGLKLFKPTYYIGVSRQLTKWAEDELKIEYKNVFLLSNTIVPDKKVNYVHDSNRKSAIMIANIRPTKNIEFAISVFKTLDWNLTIYGNNWDNAYYEEIINLIGGSNKIQVVQGITDFKQLFNKYSIAVHTAKSETGPLVLLEYMAYGIPFVSFTTGEIANVVADELPMHFINSFDTAEWIKRIELINNIETTAGLVTAFNKYFGPERYIEECLNIYRKIYY